ncbi:acyl-CoA dehydrogenase [Mangrovimicrobium sediminis]|uniref:Acyl-CoA dehydrogenase n=1 Tax=Mangrovimicrobium sediminis TaxID=2562682 RepID=A0A4Z0LVY3_9GAMM|nr:acyl-CoA dehydrogenase family protein [Haliea sp. SAOS-164]TGD71298.1 acyl-CoA dehydrogenase [Haliea sp. SAOS-164]
MDLVFSEADLDFRARARSWLRDNIPATARPAHGAAAAQFDRDWQRRLYEHGWAGVNWPQEFGGLGLPEVQQVIWYEECARAGAPNYINTTYVALMHAGPTLIACGTEAQKAFHLPRILSGESLWCQGFSEPNAGSDLASLKTSAVVDGDHLVVNGSKTWTTDGQHADFQELLIRTEPGSQRHRGLTWVICDMTTPGISMTPIRTMLGDEHVNTTFYDDVRIPLANVVGEMGSGWKTAMSTLSFERGTGFIGDQLALYERVNQAIELARRTRLEDGSLAIEDSAIASRLALIKADTLAIRAMTFAQISELQRSGNPGPKGSVMKLLVTGTSKALSHLVAEILGWEFMAFNGDRAEHPWTYEYLWSWVYTIAGGTSEIQREIIADQLLELPRAR